MPLSPSSKITFHFLVKSFNLTERSRLKKFIAALIKKEGLSLEHLSIIFCSDDYLLKINRDYLEHDFYTDIITFDLSESGKLVGEIYISIERVKENAVTYQHSFKKELHRVLFHGALHLCGYKDKSRTDIKKMRFAEDKALSRYFM